MRRVYLIFVLLTISQFVKAQISNVTFVFDYGIRTEDFETIKGQLPKFDKLVQKGKVTADVAKIPFLDNQIVRYQPKYFALPSKFQESLKCGIDPCGELYKYMLYKSSSTKMLIYNQSSQGCVYGGVSNNVTSYLAMDEMIYEFLGSKKNREINRELVIYISKSELKEKPNLSVESDGVDVDEVSVFIGENVQLSAICSEPNAKLTWKPIKSSAPSISFSPKESAYYVVEAKVGQCEPMKDSVLINIKSCDNPERIKLDFRDSKLFSFHPSKKEIIFFYRSMIAEEKSFVLITNSSCEYRSYKVLLTNIDRNSNILDKTYSLGEIKESCSLNIPGEEHEGKFVFSLKAVDDEKVFDFNYENTFELSLIGIDLSGTEKLLVKEFIQFSPCP